MFIIENLNVIFTRLDKHPIQDKPSVAPWSTMPILYVALGLLSILILVIFLRKYLRNPKIVNILMFCYGLVFLALEVYHEINRYRNLGFYDFSSFPFQFCSIPIYFCLILPFIHEGKVKDSFYYYFGIYCFVSGLFPLFFGQAQLCRWTNQFDVFRSFLWHILILHVSIISFIYRPIAHDLKKSYVPLLGAIGIFVSLTVVAQVLNVTLHYAGGYRFPVPNGALFKTPKTVSLADPDSAGCFYISPYIQATMPVYSKIWVKFGWFWNYIIYLFSFTLLAVIIYFIHYSIYQVYLFVSKRVKKVDQIASN